MSTGKILDGLNESQMEAVCHTGSPLLILAGAGSGKTRVITTKIAWLIENNYVRPEEILAVTFTNKAAREMAKRASNLNLLAGAATIRTFHSFGAWILRQYGGMLGLSENFRIYDTDDAVTLLKKAMPEINRQTAKIYVNMISRAKDYCYTPKMAQKNLFLQNKKFDEAYEKYDARLKQTGNVDFGDLIMLPVMLLEKYEHIRHRLQMRYKVIMVDEYQDSNIAQFKFLTGLKGEQNYLCVVGDDDQSIYKFRGAEVKNILQFEENFENTKVIRLEKNYRSFSGILDVANCIIKNNSGRLGKSLESVRGEGKKPKVNFFLNNNAEVEYCVRLIKDAVKKGTAFSDWAILYRTNAQSLAFETEFAKSRIPYRLVGNVRFYEREEIKDALAIFALIANDRDEVAFSRIVNKPSRGIGAKTQEKLIAFVRKAVYEKFESSENLKENSEYGFISVLSEKTEVPDISKKARKGLKEFISMIVELRKKLSFNENFEVSDNNGLLTGSSLGKFVSFAISVAGLADYYKNEDNVSGTRKIENLQELINTASLYESSYEGLREFLEHVELDRTLQSENDNQENNAVTLITVHNTKGLEFNNVVITGVEEGVFPLDSSEIENIEEERRLMYVACTRAKNELYITACAKRFRYGNWSQMIKSRFIDEIDTGLVEIEDFSMQGGNKNFAFKNKVQQKIRSDVSGFSKIIDHSAFAKSQSVTYQNWKKGVRVFSSDRGFGIVKSLEINAGEIVMRVQFETGEQKVYMPEFSTGDLEILKT